MAKEYGIFDILGPIMIGPSSSHTAGAARLGKVARGIVGKEVKSVKFLLHGSFAETYKGHGTDRAIVAGVLGMDPGDEKLRDALEIAKEVGLDFEFIETNLGDFQHPNTVKLIFKTKCGEEVEIIGSSIGGGSITVTNIDGTEVSLSGNKPTVVIKHKNKEGVISNVTRVLAINKINIDVIRVERSTYKGESVVLIEVDSKIGKDILEEVSKIDNVLYARMINPL